MYLLTAVGLTLCAAMYAQQPAAPQPAATETKKAKLSGLVVSAASKEPVRRAEVTLYPVGGSSTTFSSDGPPGTRRTSTDQEGKYFFADVEPALYQLSAQKAGFLRGSYGSRGISFSSTQIRVATGQELGDLKIELAPQAVISGRVLDEAGEPLQNLPVMVMQTRYMDGSKRMMSAGGGQTNDRGEFRILNIYPGQVTLQVSPMRGSFGAPSGATDAAPNMAYVTTYYPGTTDQAHATKIDVAAGAEMSGFEIRLQKAKVVRVAGKVLDAQGQPARNPFLTLQTKDSPFFGPMMAQARGGAEGAFELPAIQPGVYTLAVQMESGSSRNSHREALIVGDDNIKDLVIRMAPPTKLEGTVVVKGDVKVDLQTVRVMLTDETGQTGPGMGGAQPAREDGTFTLENISPGRYRLRTQFLPVDGAYVESVQYGDQDVSSKEIEIAGGGAATARIVINAGAGSLTGMVKNDSGPAPGAMIVLLPADKTKRDQLSVKMSPTDQTANFTLKNVPPGDYLAFAFQNLEEYGFWFEDERLKKIESQAEKVSVPRGGSASASLKATPVPPQ